MLSSLAREKSQTWLASFCVGLKEAVWLAAICVVPLLLNPQSPRAGYQPFKYGFLRVLAVLGVAAWLVCEIERRSFAIDVRSRLAALGRSPLSILLVVFALVVIASTSFSVYPSISFWGAYETFQGALTYAAELTLLALVACNLRRRDQVERLVTVLLVTSFAVAACAILQRFGWDPRHPNLLGERVFSTAGHPIYLAGYLLMCVPLTIYRLLALREWRQAGRIRGMAIGFYLAVLVTQLTAFVFAESRGPTLALGASVLTFGILYAAYHRWKRALAIAAVAVIVAAGSLALGGSALKSLGVVPGLKRFAETTPLQKGVEMFRADLWKQAPSIIFAREPLPHPTGGVDRWHSLRPWIGYGPETLECVLPIHYMVSSEQNAIENRFHNLVWDLWFSLGAIGLSAFLAFVVVLFFASYQRLGFVGSRATAGVFWITVPLSSAAGVALFTGFLGIGFAGAGLLGGLVIGLLLSACLSILRGTNEERPRLSQANILMLALLAGIAGHVIDTAFAFPSAPTAVLFWTYAAVVIALRRGAADQPAEPVETKRKTNKPQREGRCSTEFTFASVAIVTLGVLTLSYSFIHHYAYQVLSFSDVLRFSLFSPSGPDAYSVLLIALVAFWVAASFAFALDSAVADGTKKIGRHFAWTLIIAGVTGLAYALLRSGQIAAIGPIPEMSATDSSPLEQARGYENLFMSGTVILLILIFAIALGLTRASFSAAAFATPLGLFAAGLALIMVFAGGRAIAITPLRAAVCAAWGEALDITARSRLSPATYRRAIAFNPRPFFYSATLSEVLVNETRRIPDNALAKTYFIEAERVLLDARKSTDLNRSGFYLGKLYLIWAEREAEPMKALLERNAVENLRQARVFEPHTEKVAELGAIAEKILAGRSGDRAR